MTITSQTDLLTGMCRPLLALILTSVVVMGSPGPSTISATAVGAAYGLRRSLTYVCGLILGTIAVLLSVGIGVVAILVSIPHAAPVLLAISALYILYLAWRIAVAPPLGEVGEKAAAPAFAGGLALAITNPKAYLAIGAVFAGTSVFPENPVFDTVAKTTALAGMIVIIHAFWLLVGASLSEFLRHPIASRVTNVSLAIALVATTAITFWG
jgi:threonine/homoserine/homoserine lactone efflux protein